MDLSAEDIEAWVARQLARFPERDEVWGESIVATYLGETSSPEGIAA